MKSRFSFSETVIVHMLSWLTAVMGVINVLSAITPSLKDRLRLLEQYSPFAISTGGHLTSALAGFALLLLAFSLWRRKRIGWILTVAILIISIPTHLLKGLDYEEASFAAVLLVLLFFTRNYFHARSDAPSVRAGLLAVLAALGFTLAYGILGFYLLDRHFKISFGLWMAFRQTIVMFTQFYDPGLQSLPTTKFGTYFSDSIYIVGAVTMGYALFMLLRPVLTRRVASDEERARATEIVRAFGRTSLARYALLDDKQFFFSPNGSVISFVVENRVALALGDPIGPPEDVPDAIAAFKSFCAPNDWLTAFYQVMPTHLEVYKAAGFDTLTLGQEAIVDLSTFTLAGGENKTLRNSFNKMERLGYRADVVQPPFSPRMLRELDSISDEWLTSRGASELRFSLGWFDEAYLNTGPLLLVRDREGFIEAFTNVVTEYQANEVTVDLMRHRQHTDSALMDFLFVSLLQWAHAQGFSTFNLGLSALSGVGEHSKDPVIERALNYIYRNVNRFYNFRGLHAFKEKFHPAWSPRYLVYPSAPNLPTVSVAILRANLGGGVISSLFRSR
jgi:phosphatidylglycerol lysyltransferase